METSEKNTRTHIGRKISRIRELRGMKQETLASELGITQQAISKLEQSEVIEDSTLSKIASVLGVSIEGIKSFNEETILNIISNTFTSNDSSTINAINVQPNFNPLEKYVEAIEENKKLYERLLASEREKVEILRSK